MPFEVTMDVDTENVATVRLSGELDAHAAAQLNDLVVQAEKQEVSRLVLLMTELSYLSSAGLRALVFAHQKLPGTTEIVLVGTQPDVAETIRLTGFDRSVVMQESAGA
jgi:anti-anti-sigma factor